MSWIVTYTALYSGMRDDEPQDEWAVFVGPQARAAAEARYEELLKMEDVFTVSLCQVVRSLDYYETGA